MGNREEFLEALDQFFRRRPPLSALMWHVETIEANGSFTIPDGKIYEVYVQINSGDSLYLVQGDFISTIGYHEDPLGTVYGAGPLWMPCTINAMWSDLLTDNEFGLYSMASQGWILTEKQLIRVASAASFRVMWRDVTHRQ